MLFIWNKFRSKLWVFFSWILRLFTILPKLKFFWFIILANFWIQKIIFAFLIAPVCQYFTHTVKPTVNCNKMVICTCCENIAGIFCVLLYSKFMVVAKYSSRKNKNIILYILVIQISMNFQIRLGAINMYSCIHYYMYVNN